LGSSSIRNQPPRGGAHRAESGDRGAYDDWVWTPQAEKEFDKFPDVMQGNFFDLIQRVLDRQTRAGAGDVKSVHRGIFELRDRHKNNHYRVLWFVHDRVCVAVTCFYKNTQKTEKKDIDRAIARRKAYLRDL
jgi:phage-related protein